VVLAGSALAKSKVIGGRLYDRLYYKLTFWWDSNVMSNVYSVSGAVNYRQQLFLILLTTSSACHSVDFRKALMGLLRLC